MGQLAKLMLSHTKKMDSLLVFHSIKGNEVKRINKIVQDWQVFQFLSSLLLTKDAELRVAIKGNDREIIGQGIYLNGYAIYSVFLRNGHAGCLETVSFYHQSGMTSVPD